MVKFSIDVNKAKLTRGASLDIFFVLALTNAIRSLILNIIYIYIIHRQFSESFFFANYRTSLINLVAIVRKTYYTISVILLYWFYSFFQMFH